MKIIKYAQEITTTSGISLLFIIPAVAYFIGIDMQMKALLFTVSFFAAFLVMIIRPLADICPEYTLLKKLVILRKGVGILSASIIVSLMLQQIVLHGSSYFASVFSLNYLSLKNFALFAHLGDITGLILLITSNSLSQRVLKGNWKRVQKLSYVYFYSGGIYEAFFLGSIFAYLALFIVTNLTALAWAMKIHRSKM